MKHPLAIVAVSLVAVAMMDHSFRQPVDTDRSGVAVTKSVIGGGEPNAGYGWSPRQHAGVSASRDDDADRPGLDAVWTRAVAAKPEREVRPVYPAREVPAQSGSGANGTAHSEPGGARSGTGGEDLVCESPSETDFATASRQQVAGPGAISSEAGTISFWFQPGWSGDNQADALLVATGDLRLRIRKNVHFLRFELADDAWNESGVGTSIAEWEPSDGHLITATWDGSSMALYADGHLAARREYSSFALAEGTHTYVGDESNGAAVAPGRIRRVQVFARALSQDEIAAGLVQRTKGNE